MYDMNMVLSAIDKNAIAILSLCAAAMICNYIFFIAGALRGFRDKVYPFSVFCTLFWLSGDGSVVLDYDFAFNQSGHWYVKAFWFALTMTVIFEILYFYMIIRFGREEIAPKMTQTQFSASMVGALIITFVSYRLIKENLNDPLFINYFNLANMAGPVFTWALLSSRGNLLGTRPLVWINYAGVCIFWYIAVVLFYGAPFNTPLYLVFFAVNIIAALALAIRTLRMSPARGATITSNVGG